MRAGRGPLLRRRFLTHLLELKSLFESRERETTAHKQTVKQTFKQDHC
jgi:hypothetical protein